MIPSHKRGTSLTPDTISKAQLPVCVLDSPDLRRLGGEGDISVRSKDHRDTLIGRTIAHYEILAKLGEGGMGVVYRARDTKLDREIALKILPPDVAAIAERRQRFAREVKAIAALNHPHIVTIHAVEATADHRFYTMELVDGPSLGELMHKHGLPLS